MSFEALKNYSRENFKMCAKHWQYFPLVILASLTWFEVEVHLHAGVGRWGAAFDPHTRGYDHAA